MKIRRVEMIFFIWNEVKWKVHMMAMMRSEIWLFKLSIPECSAAEIAFHAKGQKRKLTVLWHDKIFVIRFNSFFVISVLAIQNFLSVTIELYAKDADWRKSFTNWIRQSFIIDASLHTKVAVKENKNSGDDTSESF